MLGMKYLRFQNSKKLLSAEKEGKRRQSLIIFLF